MTANNNQRKEHFVNLKENQEALVTFSKMGSVYPCEIKVVAGGGRVDRVELNNTAFEEPLELTPEEFNKAVQREEPNENGASIEVVGGN